ncbi:RHNO1 protein, partial [Psilopogon haemacephalus]|nr:RHNO1 protein [Psilopogon haemacephalus]
MPPKKCVYKVPKAELVFLERPREGPIHCYETALLSTKNPRRISTKPLDQNTSANWVCPQFETTKSVVLKGHWKQHCGAHKTQNKDFSHSFLCAGGACKKAVACKFLPLTFENPEGFAVHLSSHMNCTRRNSQPNKRTAAKANIQVHSEDTCREVLLLPAPQPVESEVFSPPGTDTPEVPSVRNNRCSSTLLKRSGNVWCPEKELAFGIDPCGKGESAALLVTDTPEHEYGVKVTWRQRPHLMKYLQERG